jgi:SAM-dependent methyltransferase
MPSTETSRSCCDRDVARLDYDGKDIAAELARWRSGRLHPATQELIAVVRREGVAGATLLDVGAGVGAVHIELLEAGVATALDVDASPDYLEAARREAELRGLAGRVEYRYGDVVELAAVLPPADVVTLDGVICCYPDLQALIGAAASVGPRLIGMTYPRDTWWMRAYMRLWNLGHALRGGHARFFIHRQGELSRLLTEAGFLAIHDGGTREWRVLVCRRS